MPQFDGNLLYDRLARGSTARLGDDELDDLVILRFVKSCFP